jgi:GTP-binding protein Era
LEPLIQECQKLKPASIVSISAVRSAGLVDLEREILEHLPEGPAYFPEDQVTDQSERSMVSEIIREKIMDLTEQEVPYSVTVLIESFEEPVPPKKITIIQAAIITERDSQKAILIGKGGSMIKKIGELARKEIEKTLGKPVYLELFVRVEKEWSQDPKKVKEFEYDA